jgi:hypothetical protein
MKESYSEALARHAGLESYADRGNTVGVATAGVHAGPVLSSERFFISRADVFQMAEGNTAGCARWQAPRGHDGVEDLVHVWKLQAREPGDPISSSATTSRTASEPH